MSKCLELSLLKTGGIIFSDDDSIDRVDFLADVRKGDAVWVIYRDGSMERALVRGSSELPPPTTPEPTKSVLLEAESLVNGDRRAAYGDVKLNFGRWADACKAHAIDVTPAQLAMIMVLGKLSRETNKKKRDNIVDACGYLELYYRLIDDL
jgi:hypothetical protein